jgi:sulfite reductase (ferredoxin)
VSGTTLLALADLVESHGSARIRLTPHQKLLVLDVEASQVEPLVEALKGIGLEARPSLFRRNTMACTGIEYCKLAIVETKGLAAKTVATLEERLVDIIKEIDVPVTLNINGCPNSCARIQVADIGLKGQLVTDDAGNLVGGFQVHLGGTLGLDAGFGRKVRGLKTTAEELPVYVERVVRNFAVDREPGERFATWALRANEDLLV